jgi:hypothetical protein
MPVQAPPRQFPVCFHSEPTRVEFPAKYRCFPPQNCHSQVTSVSWSIGYLPISDKLPRLFRSMMLMIMNEWCWYQCNYCHVPQEDMWTPWGCSAFISSSLEPTGPLPRWYEPSTGPFAVSDETSPHPHTPPYFTSIRILSCCLGQPILFQVFRLRFCIRF